MTEDTHSTMKRTESGLNLFFHITNSLSVSFEQLDWLLRHRPNSSKLANEAHIVYTLNKTGQWLHEHDEKQVMELIKWSKEQLKSVIDTENKRLRELDVNLLKSV